MTSKVLFYSCCFRENWLTRYSPTTSSALSSIRWCFLFVTLFNLQGTYRTQRFVAILSHLHPFVKYFFQETFQTSFASVVATFLFYHTQKNLSSTFFQKFFELVFCSHAATLSVYHIVCRLSSSFFDRFRSPEPFRAPRSTASLDYQIPPHLSTTFFILFRIFWYSPFAQLITPLRSGFAA